MTRLKRTDRRISLDPHECGIKGQERTVHKALAKVNFFLPSELEAGLLYGSNAPEQSARAFAELGPSVVAIKLGANGSLLYEAARRRVTHVPAYPAAVSDPTGAGDASCGGFLAGFLLTGDPVAAAQHATVSASFAVEAVGALAIRQPSKAEATARLQIVADRTACSPHL